jgi:hypothetical protein
MEATAVHPNRALQEFFARSIRKMAYIIAFWVDNTDPEKLNWVPGEPGVSKARPIFDQINELININRARAATFRGEPSENLPRAAVTTAAQAREELLSSANEVADLLLALPPEKLNEEVDSFLGRMPLLDILEISLLWNMSYHGGVINAYQLMYGDEKFHIPPMG